MTGTYAARAATGRSGPRLALIGERGSVLPLGLAVWGFSDLGQGGDDDGSTPGGPTGPNPSSSQPAPTSAGTDGEAPPGDAAIQLTSTVGPDSRNVLVQGSRFGPNEEVVLSVDGTEAKRLQADPSARSLPRSRCRSQNPASSCARTGGRPTGRLVALSRSRRGGAAGRSGRRAAESDLVAVRVAEGGLPDA